MLIPFTYNNIHPLVIGLKSLRLILHIFRKKIRFPLCCIIGTVRQAQWIVRRPPASESCTAVSIYKKIIYIVCLSQKETGIQYSILIELIEIPQRFFCLVSN